MHSSKLHPAVTFHNVGLKMLRANAKHPSDECILVTLPGLWSFLGWDYVDIVKIDCEGCEVALARDILEEKYASPRPRGPNLHQDAWD